MTLGSRHIPLLYIFKFCNRRYENLAVIASSHPGSSGKMRVRKVKDISGARSGERDGQLVACLRQSVPIETLDRTEVPPKLQ